MNATMKQPPGPIGRPEVAQEDYVSLYHRAFQEFGASALWSSRPVPDPTPEDALAITGSLRVEGNLAARRLAERIEQACRQTTMPYL